MRYWGEVHRRAFGEAAKAARLESWERVLGAVLTIVIPGLLVWWIMGPTGFDTASATRIAGTAIVFPIALTLFYGWHFVKVQRTLYEEAESRATSITDKLAAYEQDRLNPKIKIVGTRTAVVKDYVGDGRHPRVRFVVQVEIATATTAAIRTCRAHLVTVNKQSATGTWEAIYSDSNVLCVWSAQEATEIDIPPGISQFLNIAAASNQLHTIRLIPEVKPVVHRLREIMQERGIFQFQVAITGEGVAAPHRFSVTIDGTVRSTDQLAPVLS